MKCRLAVVGLTLCWGWRVPFALSIILIGVGLWIRLGILETPVFQQLLDEDKIEKAPIIEVFKKQPREIILSLLRMGQQAPFYIFTAFIFAYAVGTLHMSRNLILSAVLVASCVSFVRIPLFGHMSRGGGLAPMRNLVRRFLGVPVSRSIIARCNSAAPRTASTTLANSASSPSPVFLTISAVIALAWIALILAAPLKAW